MKKEVVFLFGAESDFQKEYNRLLVQSDRAAERFYTIIDQSLNNISKYPNIGTVYGDKFRKLTLIGFELGIFYIIENNRVVIHAILNLRQSTKNIKNRLGVL